jgi:hypothetical protein
MIGAGGKFFGGVQVPAGGGGGGAVDKVFADNGVSLAPGSTIALPTVVLGDNGDNSAEFINERFINQDGYALILTGIGNAATSGDPSILFIEDPSRVAASSPFLKFLNAGGEVGRIDFDDLENTWIGFASGSNNITGNGNTAVGKNALASNVTGFDNTAIGINALILETDGHNNNAFGLNALGNMTTGFNNVGVGNNTLFDETTGIRNTAIGGAAGSFIQGGEDNVFIGFAAGFGFGNPALPSSRNTFVGSQIVHAGSYGDDNTIIGYGNDESAIMGSDNIVLGENNVFTGDNVTILGSGFTTALNNIMFISPAGQNAIIGAALTGQADDGNQLQVIETESVHGASPQLEIYTDADNTVQSVFSANEWYMQNSGGADFVDLRPGLFRIQGSLFQNEQTENAVSLTDLTTDDNFNVDTTIANFINGADPGLNSNWSASAINFFADMSSPVTTSQLSATGLNVQQVAAPNPSTFVGADFIQLTDGILNSANVNPNNFNCSDGTDQSVLSFDYGKISGALSALPFATLDVYGSVATINPVTGLLDSAWQMGDVTAAAAVLDAGHYIPIQINGVAHKLALIV